MKRPPALALQALHKHFGSTEVVCGLDLCVQAGERVALIGPNGAGKSTVFNLISGHARPSAGTVELHGRSIHGMKPFAIARLGLARSFQISKVFPQLSVYDNLRCSVLWSLGYGYSFVRLVGSLRDATARTDALDRHWRNARTHTVHDPIRWKYQHIGRALLHGVPPPLHSAI